MRIFLLAILSLFAAKSFATEPTKVLSCSLGEQDEMYIEFYHDNDNVDEAKGKAYLSLGDSGKFNKGTPQNGMINFACTMKPGQYGVDLNCGQADDGREPISLTLDSSYNNAQIDGDSDYFSCSEL